MLLLLGDPGVGKTALLAEAAREARSAGIRVLAAAGRESEQDLAFAGLHQLLRPVLDRVAGLPARQAEALRGAFALSEHPVPPDALLTGIAVLTLLSALSDDGPLLVAADDAQWLDRASLDALAFAARRLESEQLVLLVGARGNVPPAGFERDFPQLLLAPLSPPDAGRLLDAQPHPPRGRPREQVLAQAAGNPLALIELTKMIAADPDAGRRWAAEPIPLTGRLTAIMTARYAVLPGTARAALLLAAAADSPDLAAAAVPGLSAGVLAPAEAAGLIRLDTPGPQFTHPLVRSAVYHAAPFAERAAAHLKVADALRDQPDRYAWHLAAAALEPDEHVASLLEDSAAQAQRRGGAAAAARALERAAELSPAERDKARRLLAAADLALPGRTGRLGTRTGGQGAHADIRPGPAHRRPAGYRLVAAVVEPARRRARNTHLASPPRHPRGGRLSRGRPPGWPLRSPTRPGSPKPAPGHVPPWTRSTPWACGCRRLGPGGRQRRREPDMDHSVHGPVRRKSRNRPLPAPDSRRVPLRPGQGRRGGLDPGRDRTSGQGAARSPQPAARARRPRRQRRRALGAGMGVYRQRALGRRARRRPRGERHRRRLQDGDRRRLGRPGHGDRPGHAR